MTDAWLRRCFLESTRVLLLAGAVASFLVPLWRERTGSDVVAGAGADVDAPVSHSVLPALGRVLTLDLDDLGTRDAHPFSLVGGTWVVRIGLVLLVVGLAVLVVVTVSDWAQDHGSGRRLVLGLSVGAVLVGVVAAWLGTAWLPDDDLSLGLTAAALVPVVTAVWAAFDLRWTARLE